MIEILNISDSGSRVDPLKLEEYLFWLEEHLDPAHREDVEKLQYDTFLFLKTDRIPVLISTRNDVAHLSNEKSEWPVYAFNEMWHDPAAMLLNELYPVYESILLKDDKVFTLRPNLSQFFIPGFFGAAGILAGNNLDDMPFINFVPGLEDIEKIIDSEIDIESSFMMEKFQSIIREWEIILAVYPKLSKWIHFALPDLQGPFNVYFLLRGVEAYIDFFDNPDLIDRLMNKITKVIGKTAKTMALFLGEEEKGYCWNYGYPGLLRNVDDNSTLISRDQYMRFVHPWNIRLTAMCGGGIHHYCGDGKHIAKDIMSIPGIRGLNFGNPEMQDWEFITKLSRETKTVLLWDQRIEPVDFKKLTPEGLILKVIVPDIEKGKEYIKELGRTCYV